MTAVRADINRLSGVHAGPVSAAAGGPVAIHQFIPALNPHDATGSHTLRTREVLRRAGWRSEIFAEAIHDDLAAEAYKYWAYKEHRGARRRRHVPVHDLVLAGRVPGGASSCR